MIAGLVDYHANGLAKILASLVYIHMYLSLECNYHQEKTFP